MAGSDRPTFPARLDVRDGPRAYGAVRARAPLTSGIDVRFAADPIAARAGLLTALTQRGLRDDHVLQALGAIDRRGFVDGALAPRAYEDAALPIGLMQTISKPSVVARMLEVLLQGIARDAAGMPGRVLEIGTGCGYQAAVLAQVVREVYSVERLRGLHERARANLRPLRMANVRLILGDGMLGYPEGAPYAGIIAAAGGAAVPDAWIDQLAVGGRIVAPMQHGAGQALVVIDKTPSEVTQQVLERVHFVPLKSGVV